MHNHICHRHIDEYKKGAPKHEMVSVPENIGRNLHYRHNVCQPKNKTTLECIDNVSADKVFQDDVMLKYRHALVSSIKNRTGHL